MALSIDRAALGPDRRAARGVLAWVVRAGLAHGPDYRRPVEPNGWVARPMAPLDGSASVAGTDEHPNPEDARREDLGRPRRDRGPGAPAVLDIDLHLVHEVTSPQAFDGLRERGLKVRRPDRTSPRRPLHPDHRSQPADPRRDRGARSHAAARRTAASSASRCTRPRRRTRASSTSSAPSWLTQPGMTIVCGDSHTATHGAFGALAFGIGTSEVEHVLATQCLLQRRPRRFEVHVEAGCGPASRPRTSSSPSSRRSASAAAPATSSSTPARPSAPSSMEERMTVCNMSIEGGARAGTDRARRHHVRIPRRPPERAEGRRLGRGRRALAAAAHRRRRRLTTAKSPSTPTALEPMITYGTNPGMASPSPAPSPIPRMSPTPARAPR